MLATEVEDIKAEITKKNDRLPELKTNEEYQANLREIDNLKKRVTAKEDEGVQLMEQLEAVQKDLKDLESSAKDLTSKMSDDFGKLDGETESVNDRIEKLQAQRDKRAKELKGRVASVYKRLCTKKKGPIISIIREDGSCRHCSMLIPPQVVNMVIGGNCDKVCASCSCMLAYEAPAKEDS